MNELNIIEWEEKIDWSKITPYENVKELLILRKQIEEVILNRDPQALIHFELYLLSLNDA